jgi:hypothetical protein
VDPSELPQDKEWGDGGEAFNPLVALATTTIAEAASLLMIAWPEFVEYRDCVFLKWSFSQSNVDTWFEELSGNGPAVEGVVNHLHLWDAFSLNGPADYRAASAMSANIANMWRAALRDAFPDREFDVTLTDEPDDYGPTLTLNSRRRKSRFRTFVRLGRRRAGPGRAACEAEAGL